MRVYLINPSDVSFGVGVITPRWLFVLGGATPAKYGDPVIVDETLESFDPEQVEPGDVVGIGIHSLNALAGYRAGKKARERGATVVFGGIHATLYPEEAHERGGAHAVVRGDGDRVWPQVLADCTNGGPERIYEAGQVGGNHFQPARWDLMKPSDYMLASVQTVRGCPKHCSFCSVWRTDGQEPRQYTIEAAVREVVELRRLGFRFIILADDNFYPVTLTDLKHAARREDKSHLRHLEALRAERFRLMEHFAELPRDVILMTQITMEAAEDIEFLQAMRKGHVRGALVGVESISPDGLKSVYKDFNSTGDELVRRLKTFRENGVYILGSFIFGLPGDTEETFKATAQLAQDAGLPLAQFVLLTPFPGTVDFERWEKSEQSRREVDGTPLNRYWLIPSHQRPKFYAPHPTMSADKLRQHTQEAWDEFYKTRNVWKRSELAGSLRDKLAFGIFSKVYRQIYAKTGVATDSARKSRAKRWARMLAKPSGQLLRAAPMPELPYPDSVARKPAALPVLSGD